MNVAETTGTIQEFLMKHDSKPDTKWMTFGELRQYVNEHNYKSHDAAQQDATRGAFQAAGWFDVIVLNRETKKLIDGQGRLELPGVPDDERAPVLIGSWSEDQEEKLIMMLDATTAMAEADADKFRVIANRIETDNELVRKGIDAAAEMFDIELEPMEPANGVPIDNSAPDEAEELIENSKQYLLFFKTADAEIFKARIEKLKAHHGKTDTTGVMMKLLEI